MKMYAKNVKIIENFAFLHVSCKEKAILRRYGIWL